MSTLQFKLTQAGIALVASTQGFTIDAVGFGDRGYAPIGTETALRSQRERVAVTSGAVNGNTITLEPILTSNLDFLIREIGIYLDDGTLFALWSSATTTAGHKTENSQFQILITLIIEGVSSERIAINVIEFGHANLTVHIEDTDNPHGVTLEQLGGLGAAEKAVDADLLDGKDGKIYAPPGAVISFAASSTPSGWIECNGASLSRTAYAVLYAAIGTVFGEGTDSTTFSLPDLRGEFIRGWDHGRGVDSDRDFGGDQSDAIRNITGQIVGVSETFGSGGSATGAFAKIDETRGFTPQLSDRSNAGIADFDASRVVPTASENRPRNIAMLFCIKY